MIELNWQSHTRLELLQRIIDDRGYKKYLEIGCDKNQVFDNIRVDKKEGVDPNRGGTHRMTSDEYFAKTCECTKWDLIFIDGLHEYEQVRRDFWNCYARINPGGTIVIHDMLPMTPGQATAEPTEKAWLGDVWKLGFELLGKEFIDFNIMTFDYGCGVVGPGGSQFPVKFAEENRDWAFYEENYRHLPLTTWEEYFNA